MIEVYPCGTKITFNTRTGVIKSIVIEQKSVVYVIAFWEGNDYKQVQLCEYEFDVGEVTPQPIGFK